MPPTNIRLGAASGRPPTENGEFWLVRPDLGFFAVASPFGRCSVATRFVLETLAAQFEALAPIPQTVEEPDAALFREAILATEERWRARARDDASLQHLVVAFAGILLREYHTVVAHLGYCRVHLIRSGQVLGQTTDHAQRVDGGRHAVLRAVGPRFESRGVSLGEATPTTSS